MIQDRVFSRANSCSSAEPRLTAFSKARRAALWTAIAANIGSGEDASAALAGMATAAVAATAAAVERKPRRVVLVELVIDFLALPKVEGFDGRRRRVLTHAEDGPCAADAAALDIASLFTGMVRFRRLME